MATRKPRTTRNAKAARAAAPPPADDGPITFVLRGVIDSAPSSPATRGAAAAPLPAGLLRGRIKQSVRVGALRAASPASEVRVTAVPGQDVVVLQIAGGPTLTLHPHTARDLMLGQQSETQRSRGAGGAAAAPDEVQVPTQLQWRGLESAAAARGASRGLLGNVLIAALEVVTDLGGDSLADLSAIEVARRVDAQVLPGVYALNAASLPRLKGSGAPALASLPASDAPLLVLIHGTFSNTAGTFAKLWTQHPQRVASLFRQYADRVYALEHATLGVSPVANALALAQVLPPGARLHLATHSRGGLVAEVLARVCGNPLLGDEDLAAFTADEQRTLRQLAALAAAKALRVERVVRVACPARGTLLASQRLDAYLSVFKWTLELAAIPVLPEIVEFLTAVAQRRTDPALLPGLAAQIPDSALIQWLHAASEPVPGELRVVAGDIEGDSVTTWLKTLLADAFYWTDNDLVVQTRSMYGGAPRAAGASFLLDRGGRVSHFDYFRNERTAEAIVNALTQSAPEGFRVIGPLSWAGESAAGVRAARRGSTRTREDPRAASDKPAVILLPGILGSHLAVNGKRIWLGLRLVGGLKKLAYPNLPNTTVEPDGAIGSIYDDLAEYLSATHEVIEFSFDWRRPIEEEAQRLAQVAAAALAARDGSSQPVRFVAHSMGGLVARTMQLEAPEVWNRVMSRPGARLLMLGTPNGGSWAPMQVLSGDDTFGNTLVAFGAPFQDHSARQLMAQFPGFIQLQASLLDERLGLDRSQTWAKLAQDDLDSVRQYNWWHSDERQLEAYTWGVPAQPVLDAAKALRLRLDAQRDGQLAAFADKLLLVVGNARFTPDGFETGPQGLAYLDAPDDGDGRVTRSSARLPGVRTWQVDCEHGKLPDHEDAFAAYLDLLDSGGTGSNQLTPLPELALAARAGLSSVALPTPVHPVRSRPSRMRSAPRPPESTRELADLAARDDGWVEPAAQAPALTVTVINGNLMFVRQPLLLGHYRATQLTGTEAVVNGLVGGAMRSALDAGVYPDGPGAHQIFRNRRGSDNPLQLARPEAAIVVGLGDESGLRPAALVHTVRQAIIAWAQRIAEQSAGAPVQFELAATLIGSGGTGISAGQSAQLIAQGAREANQRLDACGWPRLGRLSLIELYLDRASEAWRALQVQASGQANAWRITDSVQPGTGALRRPLDNGYRGADYDLISAISVEGRGYDAAIAYTLDTKRARTEVRAQATQGRLVRELVRQASNDANQDPQIGRTLYQLLVPVEMDPFLGGTTEMRLELDGGTAGIPWELLHNESREGGTPWAIRTKLLRKLRTAEFRAVMQDANAESGVLVIGEPQCDARLYPRLPGARAEARAVVERLTAPGALDASRVRALIADEDAATAPGAQAIVNALLERDWRIVHIAGHGEPPEKIGPEPTSHDDPPQRDGDPRGVVLCNGSFLGPREIRNMRTVPELVFVNCCFLAARNADQLLRSEPPFALAGGYDRPRFASGVAEELIKIGVRCVVAAGWAVEDGPAKQFATAFYDALLRGRRFIDAAALARQAAWDVRGSGNTWAAYQCYGDPDWVLRVDAAVQRSVSPAERFAGVSSPLGLALALETVAVETRFQRADDAPQRAAQLQAQRLRVLHLESRFAPQWGGIGAVAEAFGLCWSEIGDADLASTWYQRAVQANDASASLKAGEQLANLRVRAAEAAVQRARAARDEARRSMREAASRAVPKARAQLAAADAALRRAANQARAPMREALALLNQLLALQPSMERESLAGSAYKRMAMVQAAAGHAGEELAAIEQMKRHYAAAEQLGREGELPDIFYPALNRMAAELATDAQRPGWGGFDTADVAAVRQSLAEKTRDDPDFWSVIGLIELRLYEALAARQLSAAQPALASDYSELYQRVSAPRSWASVHDTARFVLERVAPRASASEREAGVALLALLEGFAWPKGA